MCILIVTKSRSKLKSMSTESYNLSYRRSSTESHLFALFLLGLGFGFGRVCCCCLGCRPCSGELAGFDSDGLELGLLLDLAPLRFDMWFLDVSVSWALPPSTSLDVLVLRNFSNETGNEETIRPVLSRYAADDSVRNV